MGDSVIVGVIKAANRREIGQLKRCRLRALIGSHCSCDQMKARLGDGMVLGWAEEDPCVLADIFTIIFLSVSFELYSARYLKLSY